PFLTATSPWNDAMPEPSTTRPFLIKTSYAILWSSCSRPVAVNYSNLAPAGRRQLHACAPRRRPHCHEHQRQPLGESSTFVSGLWRREVRRLFGPTRGVWIGLG